MGLFDLFGRSPRTKEPRSATATDKPFASSHSDDSQKGPVTVFEPTRYEDVEKMIDALKEGKNTIVHLEKLKPEAAIRIIDMLSGAIYALGGGVYEMEKNIFMFSPNGVEIV